MSDLTIGNLFNVNGLVAVITGGGSGLGSYVAKGLAANGAAAVYIIGRRKEKLDEVARAASKGNIIPIVGDVTDKNSLVAAAKQVEKEQGYLNVLFANSGIIGLSVKDKLPKDRQPTLDEYADAWFNSDMAEFSNTFHVNITGVFYTAMAFLKLLDAGNKKKNVQQLSQVVITSSVAAYSRKHLSGFAYNSSKAGVNHLMKQMQHSFVPYGIRVNSIAPGLYASEMTEDQNLPAGKEYGSADPNFVPVTRIGLDQDMAGTALFLMSNAGAYCNGLELLTDGGRCGILPASY